MSLKRLVQAWMLRLFRLKRGRMRFRGLPLMLLTTVGAKSGKRRSSLVCFFPVEGRSDAWLIVASNAGAARHPAWFHNLLDHPGSVTARVENRVTKVRPELLTPEERAVFWPRIAANEEFRRFQARTTRLLPVVRLIHEP